MVQDRQGVTKTVQNNPTYAAMVEKTDDSLGRIIKALKDAGVDQNTAVILTSDHGGLSTRGLSKQPSTRDIERSAASGKRIDLRRRHACSSGRQLAGKGNSRQCFRRSDNWHGPLPNDSANRRS